MTVSSRARFDRSLQRAVRTAVLSLAMASSLEVAHAEPAQSLTTLTARRYDIPAGPLGVTLARFAVQSGIALSFDPALTQDHNSPGLSGNFSGSEAVARLLAGSGLEMLSRNDGSYTLVQLPAASDGSLTLDTTSITASATPPDGLPEAYPGGQVARGGKVGMLGNRDVMDTPFSSSNYTSQLMRDQQAVTVADVLDRDPSVRSTGQVGGVVDSFYIRGFPMGEGNLGEIAFDGVYGVAPNYRAFTDYAERIEVIKGPGALLYGMSPNGGVGGVINLVPKRPLEEDLTRLTTRYASDSQLGGQIDVSRRFGFDNRFGVRVNASSQGGDTVQDHQHRDVDIGAIALDYRDEHLRLNADFITQAEKWDAPARPYLVAAGVQVPAASAGHKNTTQDWGWARTRERSGMLSGEYDLNERITLFAHAGGGKSNVARLSDQTPTFQNAAGDTLVTPGYYRFNVKRYTVDAGGRARFETGPINHTATLMVTRYRDALERGINNGTPITSNLYDPVERPEQQIASPTVLKVSQTELSGVALADTLAAMDERLQFTYGLRRQTIKSTNYSNGIATSPRYDDSATTPLAGLVYKPWDNVSLYYNYIEGLTKGDTAPATASNAGEVFAPYRSRQNEVGVKIDHGSFTTTLSAFQINKPSAELANGAYSVQGKQRNRGLELSTFGEVAPGIRLLGGVTWVDAQIIETATAANRGNRPVGVPRVQGNLWAEWDAPWVQGLTLTGGALYTGRQYVNTANSAQLDAWTRFDAGVRYTTRIEERPVTFRATVQNVFNRDYWSGVASYGAFSLGAPRTLLVSATVDF